MNITVNTYIDVDLSVEDIQHLEYIIEHKNDEKATVENIEDELSTIIQSYSKEPVVINPEGTELSIGDLVKICIEEKYKTATPTTSGPEEIGIGKLTSDDLKIQRLQHENRILKEALKGR